MSDFSPHVLCSQIQFKNTGHSITELSTQLKNWIQRTRFRIHRNTLFRVQKRILELVCMESTPKVDRDEKASITHQQQYFIHKIHESECIKKLAEQTVTEKITVEVCFVFKLT